MFASDHLSSFDIGSFPPTAQSTPVTNRRPANAAASSSVSSLLTTPNNSSISSSVNVKRESPERSGVRLSEAPRTPTPFKRALADVYQRREPLSRTVKLLTCVYNYDSGTIVGQCSSQALIQ